MTPSVIALNLASCSSSIYVGHDLFAAPDLLRSQIHAQQVMIVTQENIAALYLPTILSALQDCQCDVTYLPNGEQVKTLQQWQMIFDNLIAKQHERGTTLIALGGGVVGDITGFAAACYLRGVRFIQIPTTLIAQVDAAIGGKTAVNLAQGKNLIGVFYQPHSVLSDMSFLQTLPRREYVAGLAEVIKYGLIWDAKFFAWLENNMADLLAKDKDALTIAVTNSAAIKATVVSQDEKEQGLRSLLNFGHTFGHALEALSGYETLLHGEAVAIGMWMATRLSVEVGLLSPSDGARAERLLDRSGCLDKSYSLPAPKELIGSMQRDKKVAAGKMHFILLQAIGKAVKTADVSEEQLRKVL